VKEYRSADPGLSGPRRQLIDYHLGFLIEGWTMQQDCDPLAATGSRNCTSISPPATRIWGGSASLGDRWAAQDHHPCRRTERHSLPIPSSVSFSFRVCVWLLAKRHDRHPWSYGCSCCRV